jgi:hypothetical protein
MEPELSEDDKEELIHFTDVVISFKSYLITAMKKIANWERQFFFACESENEKNKKNDKKNVSSLFASFNFSTLKTTIGSDYMFIINELKKCAASNQEFLDFIIKPHFENLVYYSINFLFL